MLESRKLFTSKNKKECDQQNNCSCSANSESIDDRGTHTHRGLLRLKCLRPMCIKDEAKKQVRFVSVKAERHPLLPYSCHVTTYHLDHIILRRGSRVRGVHDNDDDTNITIVPAYSRARPKKRHLRSWSRRVRAR